MSKWKLVYDKSLEGYTDCCYQVYCDGKMIPCVFLDGNKKKDSKIEFTIFTGECMSRGLTEDQIKALPTDKIKFFVDDTYPDMQLCRIWATL